MRVPLSTITCLLALSAVLLLAGSSFPQGRVCLFRETLVKPDGFDSRTKDDPDSYRVIVSKAFYDFYHNHDAARAYDAVDRILKLNPRYADALIAKGNFLADQGKKKQAIEAFSGAVPGLSAATRVWRDFFDDPMEVAADGYQYIKACWESGHA